MRYRIILPIGPGSIMPLVDALRRAPKPEVTVTFGDDQCTLRSDSAVRLEELRDQLWSSVDVPVLGTDEVAVTFTAQIRMESSEASPHGEWGPAIRAHLEELWDVDIVTVDAVYGESR